jgi:hypothetical protein
MLTLARNDVLVSSLDGFGAQYNQNVHAARSREAGITPQNVTVMEERMAEFSPHVVRLFFNAEAFTDADQMQSFDKTVDLAQKTAGTINITLQALGQPMIDARPDLVPSFADKMIELVNRGVDKLRWITLRNEPNGNRPMAKDLYERCYRQLDRKLQDAGVRTKVGLMGGDLLLPNQREWFEFLASNMADSLDALSIHVYWNFNQPGKIDTRLRGVRALRESPALAAIRAKPFYVMECGVRGIETMNGVTEEPGFWTDGSRIANTRVNAFQQSWFTLEAVRQGFRGVVLWDAYFAKYDRNKLIHYSLLGGPSEAEPWPRRPAYRALRLLMRAVEPGWRAVAVKGAPARQRVVGFVDPANPARLTVAGLDTAGGKLNGASPDRTSYTIEGVPPNTTFHLCFWNRDGNGMNSFDEQARSDGRGVVTVSAPLHALFVLTTLQIS